MNQNKLVVAIRANSSFIKAAVTIMNGSQVPQQYVAAITYAASSANISPTLLASLVWQESRWNAQAVSRNCA